MGIAEAGKDSGQFKAAISRKDYTSAKRLLSKLKLHLTEMSGLPPMLEQTSTASEELQLARDVLEHGVLLSAQMDDERGFENNYMQLRPYYLDARSLMPPSQQEGTLTGLNLLRLLVQNRIAEFHTELELIPPQAQQDKCIQQIVQLEQRLMEGAYNKVLEARQHIPHPVYSHFMDKLLNTVQDEVAGCSEQAYDQLSLAEAQKMMFLTSSKQMEEYATEHGWQVNGSTIKFHPSDEAAQSSLGSAELISHSMIYARELERIV
ncbi:hypothetical protein WJX74_005703 [Apatococcus lobatus]|uniref:PCI domain-containing protein n=1 Tax=Apatococcus lobatus TaxID=904363 RepID=A0AAW1RC52_9CHLO